MVLKDLKDYLNSLSPDYDNLKIISTEDIRGSEKGSKYLTINEKILIDDFGRIDGLPKGQGYLVLYEQKNKKC